MRAFWWHWAGGLFFLAALLPFGYALGGLGGLLAVWAAAASIWLVYLGYGLFRLHHYLFMPSENRLPVRGGGLWGGIFRKLRAREHSRQRRKRKLQQALQRFRLAAEALPDGIVMLDTHDRIVWLNRRAAEHWQAGFGIGRRKGWRSRRLTDFLADGGKGRLKTEAAGKTVLLNVSQVPFGHARLVLTQDIGEAERLNAMRTAFVANVSHELRTPLTVINGFLETLADTPDLPPQSRQEFVGLMRQEGWRMQHLLDDLLTLSRLESAVEPEKESVDLSQLVSEVATAAQRLSDGKHEIAVQIEEGWRLSGVRQELYAALSNMAFNAVRYTPEGGRLRIVLAAVPSENPFAAPAVEFSVADNGIGIAAEHLPHLTERFYRVDAGRSRESGGTGLGLAICKHALARHGAHLRIESELGRGSCFSAVFAADKKIGAA